MNSNQIRNLPSLALKIPTAVAITALLAGCGGSGGDDNGGGSSFSISGDVSGLADGETLTLARDGETQTIDNNGTFTLTTDQENGVAYNVSVAQHPPSQGCEIDNASGTINGSDVTDLNVECRAPAQATADPRSKELLLNWEANADTTYNLFWATDPELDPENYASYADSGMAADVQPPFTLDGLENTRNYYLFLESEYGTSRFSERFGTRPNFAAVKGSLNAIEKDTDGNLYLGGMFSKIGYSAGGLIALDRDTELPINSPYIAGQVLTIEPDGSGGYFVAGAFIHADGQEVNSIVRLNPDLTLDSSWDVTADGAVYSMVVEDDRILLGGAFGEINDHERRGLAAIDYDGNLLSFTAPVGTAPDYDGNVNDLAVTDDHIIVAGEFAEIDGVARNNLAALMPDGTVDTGWQADADDEVVEIVQEDERLYVAGSFTEIGGANRMVAAELDSDGNVLSFDAEITSGFGMAISVINDVIYIGGSFEGPSDNLLAWHTDNYHVPLTASDPNGSVTQIHELDGDILVSGGFTAIGGDTRTGMALLNAQGELQEDLQTGIQAVFDLQSDGNTLLLGTITASNYKNVLRNNLAKLTADGNIAEWETGLDRRVYALSASDDTLYAGGLFTETDEGLARARLAAFETADGTLNTDWTPQANQAVFSMVRRSGQLHIGGDFTEINGTAQARLATLDENHQLVGHMPEPDDRVRSIVRDGTDLYLSGNFTTVDGNARNWLAAVDSTNGDLLPWAPDMSSSSQHTGGITAIDVFSGKIYLGGDFDQAEGSARQNLAAYDTNGSLLSWQPETNGRVTSLLANSGGIRINGYFEEINGSAANSFGIVDSNGDLLVTPDNASIPIANAMIEVDGGFCMAGSSDFITGKKIGGGIACVDDDLNWLW